MRWRWSRERREERRAAKRYNELINAPMSEEAARALGERLRSGDFASRKVRRRPRE